MNNSELLNLAIKAMENSYAPYSQFPVGAAILLTDGEVVLGVNVENASYGGTICAERTAITSAVAKGYRRGDFEKIAIVSNMKNITPPCAICRQVMTEFLDEKSQVIMGSKDGKMEVVSIEELVPYSFKEDSLEEIND